ncbi:MAG: glycosyltransferase [Ahrensia sp.]|nr:glycosyltransferase [Ahrensia sp.]
MEGGAFDLQGEEDTGLPEDIAFLEKFGFGRELLTCVARRAHAFDISASDCMLANGLIAERDYYRYVATELGLEFVTETGRGGHPDITLPHPRDLHRMSHMVQVEDIDDPAHPSQFGRHNVHIAPDCRQLEALKTWLSRHNGSETRLRVAPLSVNRAALEERGSSGLISQAVNGLRNRYPVISAHRVWTPRQAVVLLLILQGLAALAFFSPPAVVHIVHIVASLFYLGCIALRMLAAAYFGQSNRLRGSVKWSGVHNDSALPVYSVLVPLYQEQGQVRDLLLSLAALNWPKERLEIKLICEADDPATIKACRRVISQQKLNCASVIEVPMAEPRTKPKALSYALQLCSGSLIVVYDAEDRPHPLQLREAHTVFEASSDSIACLQSPLTIRNHRDGMLAKLFAIEYSALFDGLLPFLAAIRAPVPLGGTSNHFRREALDVLGGWDPHNVTEDADLGMRMARIGYRSAMLSLPTKEEAPVDLGVWVRQRTRWFKGWYQTWLVHMREPIKTTRQLGLRNMVLFQLLIGGMSVSALVHPFLFYFIVADSIGLATKDSWRQSFGPLIVLDIMTVLAGYLSFAWLAWKALPLRKLGALRIWLWALPVYWMLLSVSAWRALWQLSRKPHLWEKTPHRLSEPASAAEELSLRAQQSA